MFANHRHAAIAQQLVVVQQRTRNGVLDGCHAYHGGVLTHALEHLFEGVAANQLQLFALEILVGCDVVKRPCDALYRYSLHTLKRSPTFTLREAGPYLILQFFIL